MNVIPNNVGKLARPISVNADRPVRNVHCENNYSIRSRKFLACVCNVQRNKVVG